MKVEIKPSKLYGSVKAPPSKSMAHRMLICAGLCEDESRIEGIEYSEDILATLDCLETLGASVTREENFVIVRGTDPRASQGGTFFCRESGSTLRFFVPVAMLSAEKSIFRCKGRLAERPMEIYEAVAAEKGIFYEKSADGITVSGVLGGGEYRVRADVSSQFITGLLFALPLCDSDSRLVLTGKAESMSYVDITVNAQKLFGVEIRKEDNNTYYIMGSQKYKATSLSVEADYSNAAFLEAFNLLGSKVDVQGLNADTLQGDRVFYGYFEQLKNSTPTLDVSDCPDLAPVLMTLASCLNGAVLTGTKRLKIKESDRGEVMRSELSKFGADISVSENSVTVNKSKLYAPTEVLCGHNDHRVVMSLSVVCSRYGGVIDGCEAVSKSYPDFFDRVRALGMEVKIYGD